MGCIFSSFKEEPRESLLFTNRHCFICGKSFSNNVDYNRHIPKCNIATITKKK